MTETIQTQKVWILKARVPFSWKPLVEKRMKELGIYTYEEYLRHVVRKDLGVR